MKQALSFLLILSLQTSLSQSHDWLLQKVSSEKNDNKRIDLMLGSFLRLDTNLKLTLDNNQAILLQSQLKHDKIVEAIALSVFGQGFRLSGNPRKGLEYNYKAVGVAEQTGNSKVLAAIKNQLGNIYTERQDYQKAVEMYQSNVSLASVPEAANVQTWGLMNLGRIYLLMNQPDSSLMYIQRAYEICVRIKYTDFLSLILSTMGSVHSRLHNTALAIEYFRMAADEARKVKAPRYLSQACVGLAQHYYEANNTDSSLYYAKEAIAALPIQLSASAFSSRQVL